MNNKNTAIDYLSPKESEDQLNPAALELLDHIAEVLAEEYVKSIKENERKEYESSNLR